MEVPAAWPSLSLQRSQGVDWVSWWDPRPGLSAGGRAAGRLHPEAGLARAPTPLRTLPPGLGRSAAISQSNHIHGTPLCEWVLSAGHAQHSEKVVDGLRRSGYWAFDSKFFQTRKQRCRGAGEGPSSVAPWSVHSAVRSPGRETPFSDPGTKAPRTSLAPVPPGWARSLLCAGRALP